MFLLIHLVWKVFPNVSAYPPPPGVCRVGVSLCTWMPGVYVAMCELIQHDVETKIAVGTRLDSEQTFMDISQIMIPDCLPCK